MKDLTKAHVSEYKNCEGVFTLSNSDGWLIGVVGDVMGKLDPMETVALRGSYADGTTTTGTELYEVPLSICVKGAIAIMEYLIEHYSLKKP